MTVSARQSRPGGPARLILFATVLFSTHTGAQAADSISRRGDAGVSGTITGTSRAGVTLERRGETIEVPANVIENITLDGEPPVLQLGRGAERGGNLGVAVRRYEEAAAVLQNPRPVLRAEIEYALARCRAKLALVDEVEVPAAVAALEAFRAEHLTSYHYYALHEWLGRLYAVQGDAAKATAAYAELAKAPWRDFQWRALVGEGRLLTDAGDFDGARERFERVLAAAADTSAEELLQQEARLAKGQCLTAQGNHPEAEALFREIIDDTPAEEAPVQAAAHNALGDLMRQAGNPKDALLAYLYVDLLVPSEPQEHAKALYYIGQLFNEIGQPGRAEEARERLQTSYPDSPWAKKD